VVASVAQERQADLSFRAIAAGALEAVAKPAGPSADLRRWGEQMCRTVRLLSEVPVITRRAGVRGARALPSSAGKVDVLGIAASTGGPPALAQLLGGLPASLPVPLLIAQHLTPGFTAGLVRWLNEAAALTVEIARAGELPRPGTAYVAPDGCHLEVDPEGHLLTPRAIGAGPVPDANRLFESLAVAWGDRAGGLVLTGMGEDGAVGLASLSRVGGVALVQDEESSLVYGMPAAARARCPGAQQLALDQMSSFLTVLAGTPFSFQPREPSTR
jgi:two-component system chemotaxis response regulator CheB